MPQDERATQTFLEQIGRTGSELYRSFDNLIGNTAEGDYTTEFIRRARALQNPKAATAGTVVGSVADLPSYLWGGYARKGAGLIEEGLTRGATIGGVGGLLAPVYDMFGDDRVTNAAVGVALGGALGAGLGAVLRKLGFQSEAELADALRRATPEERADIEETIQEVLMLESPQAFDARKTAEEGTPSFAEQPREVQESVMQRMREGFEENIANITPRIEQESVVDALRKEFDQRIAARDAAKPDPEVEVQNRLQEEQLRIEEELVNMPNRAVRNAANGQVTALSGKLDALDTSIENLRKTLIATRNAKMVPATRRTKLNEIQQRLDNLQAQRKATFEEREAASKVKNDYDDKVELQRQYMAWRNGDGPMPNRMQEIVRQAEAEQPSLRSPTREQSFKKNWNVLPESLGGANKVKARVRQPTNRQLIRGESGIPDSPRIS